MLNRIATVPKGDPLQPRLPPVANKIADKPSVAAAHHSQGSNAEAGESVIGNDLTILGDSITIVSENRLRIEGQVRGDVAGKEVVIGPEGSVTGTVWAEKVEIFGGVTGGIHCLVATLHDTAHVDAEIVHESLALAKGAYFDGGVRRLTDRKTLMAKLDPNTYVTVGQ